MKNLTNISLAAIFMLFFVNGLFAQKKNYNFKEGTVEYALDIENAEGMVGMLQGSTLTWSIQDKNNKIDFFMAGGLAKIGLMNNVTSNLYTVLLDIPLLMNRTAIEMDDINSSMDMLNWTEDKKQNQAPKKEDIIITYQKNKRKKIGKYNCYQATVKMVGMDDIMTVYVTDALRSEAVKEVQSFFGNMKGFPLEFQLNLGGVKMTMTAQQVKKKKLGHTFFDIPESYEKKTLPEFKEEMEEQYGKDLEDKGTFGL